MSEVYTTIEDINTIHTNKLIYDTYKAKLEDKEFYSEYEAEIIAYEKSNDALEKSKYKNLNIKELSNIYNEYKDKKYILMNDYSNKSTLIYELTQLRKNTDKYIDNELYK